MGKWIIARRVIENGYWFEFVGEVCEIVYKLFG